jgi:hypothetical protein
MNSWKARLASKLACFIERERRAHGSWPIDVDDL